MNTRGIILAIMLLGIGASASGQTMVIAHRSHSGSIASFSTDGQDNFGLPPRRIDSVMRLTDSSAIEFSSQGNDTVRNHRQWNNPRIGLDSLRKLYPGVNFIGFDEPKKSRVRNSHPRRRAGTHYSENLESDEPRGGTSWLLLLGAIAVPSLAYGFWRGETRRRT